MDWTKLERSTPLSPHFTFGEYLGGVPATFLNQRMCKPEWLLSVITVAELARGRFGAILTTQGAADDYPRGIRISSGVRSSNKLAKSVHGIRGGCACDFKPLRDIRALPIAKTPEKAYKRFYGCFIWAVSRIDNHFGLGVYPNSFSGIHVDSAFTLRKDQNLVNHHNFRGHRWGQNYSYFENEEMIKALNYEYRADTTPVPWQEMAKELGVNLDLMKC